MVFFKTYSSFFFSKLIVFYLLPASDFALSNDLFANMKCVTGSLSDSANFNYGATRVGVNRKTHSIHQTKRGRRDGRLKRDCWTGTGR